jgi:hypothetical protein
LGGSAEGFVSSSFLRLEMDAGAFRFGRDLLILSFAL